ncbi:universal stress protein [Thiothrix nivea]|uniref:Universal stress protein n=1 Tax=Thiothrix nivea (strain ATCC 35100 / DSM 5205 / JP2) TaxID=870187 RepID=A0A656HG66_THINJ|nr:universal stress protein [Thiothrix nivea]EIJ35898.1 UspA domain-containing protein [Thiothrix nivea DSM 5205]
MQHYRHILAPIDFSARSNDVIKRALELAEAHDARLTLLHVVQDVPIGAEPFGEPSGLILSEELREQHLASTEKKMHELTEQYKLPISVDRAIEEGISTPTAILDFATEKQVDLIVIAHSGKKGLLGFLGSTADSIVKSANCDVLVLRNKPA